MRRDPDSPQILDYRQPDSQPSVWAGAMRWQFMIAYLLIALPVMYEVVSNHTYPVTAGEVVPLYVLMGIAVGAGLYVVRRQPRNVLGWVGFAGWGGFSLFAIINALLK